MPKLTPDPKTLKRRILVAAAFALLFASPTATADKVPDKLEPVRDVVEFVREEVNDPLTPPTCEELPEGLREVCYGKPVGVNVNGQCSGTRCVYGPSITLKNPLDPRHPVVVSPVLCADDGGEWSC